MEYGNPVYRVHIGLWETSGMDIVFSKMDMIRSMGKWPVASRNWGRAQR